MRKYNALALTTALRQKIFLITLGALLFLIFLETGLRLGGFVYLSLQEYRNRTCDRQKQAYRIMCLGESTTAMGGDNSYPSQLEKILNQRNIGIKFSVINRGVSAVTTSYILAHLEENIDKYNPRIVITMMGIGDGAPIIYRDASGGKSSSVFESLRLYKLARLIWLHLAAKKMVKDESAGVFCKNTYTSEAKFITAHNYQEVKRILDKKGIKLVCVQYPMLGVGQLKKIFEGQKGVVFVDNEGIFKGAVKKSGYQKYFIDMFGEEFGHCTREGNRILAENIANVILKECFKK